MCAVNRLLATLPADEIAILQPHLIPIPLAIRQVIHVRDQIVPDIIFVERGIASLTVDIAGAGSTEVGLIGREGLVGGSALLQPDARLVHQAFMQVAGDGLHIAKPLFLDLLWRLPTLRAACFKFLNQLATQTAQVAGCNLHHTLSERMARWLLMTRDRLDDNDLPMTQEFLAMMLGVRRGGVSLAVSGLQHAGLIRQSRGHITILNHAGLLAAACGCYQIIRDLSNGDEPRQSPHCENV